MNDCVLINYKMYSDEQNSSYLPYKSTFTGKPVWERKSLFLNNSLLPAHLAISDKYLMIRYANKIDISNKVNGASIWNKEILPIANFDLKIQGLVTVDPAGFYEVIGLDQKPVNHYSLPFLNAQTRLFFSEEKGDEIYYCYQTIPTPSNSPEDKYAGHEFVFTRFDVAGNKFIWQFVKNEFIVDVLKTKMGDKIVIASAQNIYLFDENTVSENQVQSLPFERILSASLDFNDNLLVVEETKNGKELKNLTQAGKLNWTYPLGNVILTGQPPATHPDGNIYIVTNNTLICMNGNDTKWKYLLPAHPGKALVTVLKDESVLVAAENALLHISGEGKLLTNKLFDNPLTCRPILDKEGNVYAANSNSIFVFK